LGKITTTTKMYTKMKAFLMNTKTDIWPSPMRFWNGNPGQILH
jgi:hypothetical protein